ncbi:MAG: acetyl-CoA carboxylase biotin carboxylase subunit [Armatimonadetes bacterium]|nr:acetyl-CoA carboxylase biotin carboxylase subunit [Armatimonadota bacterium]
MFRKVLIANRGEIAVRIIRACHELQVGTVAVHSEADADALHVRLADEAVCVGPPASRDSYLNAANVISAALVTGADAIHPGYGYLSEVPSFAEMCLACGLKFIGPPVEAVEKMGDKAMAREIAEKAGVPVIPGTKGTVGDEQEAARVARKIGFPLMVKAAAGGGGRGIRLVQNQDELVKVLGVARAEAESAFGNGALYIEKYLEEPRHIEFQVLADEHGHIVHLGERECSIQTPRHQKMVEEAPSTVLDARLRARMGEAAVRVARAVGYTNAGTVEFLVDRDRNFYFMEMNTRLQVEHPVTEAITGMDLVKHQIRIASGERIELSQKNIRFEGHAIECRITAEDPEHNFAPSVGEVRELILPGGFAVRVDTHLYQGYRVPPYYDPLLAKLIVWDRSREEAIDKMDRCLREFYLDGFTTNIGFHEKINANAFYRRGDISVNFIQRHISSQS